VVLPAQAAALRAGRADARFVRCDVTDAAAFAAALDSHYAAHGGLDVCFLNAGIEERDSFLDAPDDAAWQRVLNVDVTAVASGVRQVVRRLRSDGAPGVIVINASSAGIFPLPGREVYAAAKAAAVHLTRSLAHLAPAHGIRVCAVCPRFAETNMVARMLVRHPCKCDAATAAHATPSAGGPPGGEPRAD
jgi:NAD(P)-dependent dehydrogenase (short-subunit alcohol dehydrogenase family)